MGSGKMRFRREKDSVVLSMTEEEFVAITNFLREGFATVPREDFVPRTGFNESYLYNIIGSFNDAAEELGIKF